MKYDFDEKCWEYGIKASIVLGYVGRCWKRLARPPNKIRRNRKAKCSQSISFTSTLVKVIKLCLFTSLTKILNNQSVVAGKGLKCVKNRITINNQGQMPSKTGKVEINQLTYLFEKRPFL